MSYGEGADPSDMVAANPSWYHTIDLAPGVATPGYVDMRPVASRVLPDDLTGKRSLDVGTFDGFWAFEMERRGADVVAVDVDKIDAAEWPPHKRQELLRETEELGVKLGEGFRIAAEALGSRVDRRVCNIYDLSPERIGGPVDLAFVGTLLLHLRDPVRGLEAVRSVLAPGGEIRVIEPVSVRLTALSPRRSAAEFQTLSTPFNWWVPNLSALRAWMVTAGFEPQGRPRLLRPPAKREIRQTYVTLSASPV